MPITASDKGLLDPVTAGRVELERWPAAGGASALIQRFWTLQFDVSGPEIQPLLPSPCVNVAFGTADPGVHGPPRSRDDHRIEGSGWVLGAKLRPGALVAMGFRTLQRWFDRYLGLSPSWVLTRYRLQDAAAALVTGERDLAALAHRLGYCDQAHFTKAFAAAVGSPPGAYARWCRDRLESPVRARAG